MSPVRVDVHLSAGDLAATLRADVRAGLTSQPKCLLPKYLYDEAGSKLFDEITRLPEYYPTRREREILAARAPEIAARAGADTLVELGSGTSEKTRLLLDAFHATGALRRFVPFDVSESTLRDAGAAVAQEYPGVEVHAVVGDFERHLGELPADGRRMIAFLGGTIGNLPPEPRARFLRDVASALRPGESFLLGTDLVKDVARIEAAYNDTAGVTAAFNKNVLQVLNRELDGDFDPDRFDHVATWDAAQEWVDIRLRSRVAHTVRLAALDLDVAFAAGEDLHTEVSAKFRFERIDVELAAAALAPVARWTDAAGDFAVTLAMR